jgi:hypothetical protein
MTVPGIAGDSLFIRNQIQLAENEGLQKIV